jgi:uncharacterized protein with von Willebrand factor type A (vWA) domain
VSTPWFSAQPTIAPATLVHNVLVFGRLLRSAGMPMSAGREMELLGALALVDLRNRDRVYQASRAMLVSHRDHGPIFDRAFELFFSSLFARPPDPELLDRHAVPPPPDQSDAPSATDSDERTLSLEDMQSQKQIAPKDEQERATEGDETAQAQTFSAVEILREKDFDDYSPEELAAARELMRQLRLRPGVRQTRRMIRSPHGDKLDMRRIVRGMHRTAGEPAKLHWRERKVKRRQLVLLCDVSGSMERYSRVLLQFLHAARQGLTDVEVFVFGTRLTRVTRDLAHRDLDSALELIAQRVLDFAGGTRIGRSLHDFNRHWGRRVLGHGAIVIVISDGWDRGDPQILADEMARLQRSCFRLMWLNPLLGLPEYQPITIGMRTALQHVDDFLPSHNLASLERMARRLTELEARRPVRRQVPPPGM